MLRVLCFCGFTGNKYIFSQELSRLRALCADTVEFVILEPPMIVHPVDFPLGSLAARKSTGWTIERTAETTPRAWFDGGADWHGDRGFADSVAYVHKFLIEKEPFDGFFAFSSGATLAVAIVALLMKGTQHSDRNFPFHPRLQKPRFFINLSGFFIGGYSTPHPSYAPCFPLPASLPTLHVIGKNDTIVPLVETEFMAKMCLNKRVEWHMGDHFVPMKASWRGFFKAYIESFLPGGTDGQGISHPNEFSPSAISKLRSLRIQSRLDDGFMLPSIARISAEKWLNQNSRVRLMIAPVQVKTVGVPMYVLNQGGM
ncbi:hypothetical protein C359_05746 [Cryptococcus neoformans Bt120]|nr:hypothetical protein C359_05746 [Cryptococcus neoformans var. grubii Bt120]